MKLTRKQALAAAQPMKGSRGARFGGETLQYVPADQNIRPLRDNLLIEPVGVVYSRFIYVHRDTKPLRGRVLRAGPGRYPLRYLDANRDAIPDWDRKRRRYITESKTFLPMQVKVGDLVELGGSEIEGYAFEVFNWGDKAVLWATERDIAGIIDETSDAETEDSRAGAETISRPLAPRRTSERAAL